MIVMHSLPEEHLPLVQEVRLGIRAPGSETPTLLVSPVAGLPARVSMCLIHVGACAAGGQGPALRGSCSYGENVTEKVTSWLPPWGAGASRGLSDMKVGTALSPGRGYLRQGVLRKEMTWQFGGTAARPVCLTRVSRGTWRELVSEQWAVSPEMRWKPWMVQSRGGYSLMWDLKGSSDSHWRGDSRSS